MLRTVRAAGAADDPASGEARERDTGAEAAKFGLQRNHERAKGMKLCRQIRIPEYRLTADVRFLPRAR